jgi:hypothetical protein
MMMMMNDAFSEILLWLVAAVRFSNQKNYVSRKKTRLVANIPDDLSAMLAVEGGTTFLCQGAFHWG